MGMELHRADSTDTVSVTRLPASAQRKRLPTFAQVALGAIGLGIGSAVESARQNVTEALSVEEVVGIGVFL